MVSPRAVAQGPDRERNRRCPGAASAGRRDAAARRSLLATAAQPAAQGMPSRTSQRQRGPARHVPNGGLDHHDVGAPGEHHKQDRELGKIPNKGARSRAGPLGAGAIDRTSHRDAPYPIPRPGPWAVLAMPGPRAGLGASLGARAGGDRPTAAAAAPTCRKRNRPGQRPGRRLSRAATGSARRSPGRAPETPRPLPRSA